LASANKLRIAIGASLSWGDRHSSVNTGTREQSSGFVSSWRPVRSHRRPSLSRLLGSRLQGEPGAGVRRVDVLSPVFCNITLGPGCYPTSTVICGLLGMT